MYYTTGELDMAVCRKRHSSDQSLLLSIAYETVRGRPEQEGKKKKNKNNNGNRNENEEKREKRRRKREEKLWKKHIT